jgi:hypothetical protein
MPVAKQRQDRRGQVQAATAVATGLAYYFFIFGDALKQQFGYAKRRNRGLTSDTARLTMLFALSNLKMMLSQILAARGECVCDAAEGRSRR